MSIDQYIVLATVVPAGEWRTNGPDVLRRVHAALEDLARQRGLHLEESPQEVVAPLDGGTRVRITLSAGAGAPEASPAP